MSNPAIDTDVLIVGAGPVGLFLANECARRGLRWRLVETRSLQSEHSKALAVFPRTRSRNLGNAGAHSPTGRRIGSPLRPGWHHSRC